MNEDLKVFLVHSRKTMVEAAKGDIKAIAQVSCYVASFLTKYALKNRLTDDEKAVLKGMLELLSNSVDEYL